jgi:hypothetical protein
MKQQNQRNLWNEVAVDSIIVGANGGFVENLFESSMQASVASLASVDGNKIKISSYRIRIQLFGEGLAPFSCQPFIVQTAGNFTDQVNLAERKASDLLAHAVDDVFGYDLLGNTRFSKVMPSGAGTVAATLFGVETTITLPAKILQILNKESESERLQDLYMGILGVSANGTLNTRVYQEIQFIEERQKIVIR